MHDREKVMTWLEICGKDRDCSGNCPYGDGSGEYEDSRCREDLMADAFSLLKEQEAKCLTKAELDDLKENQFVWIEGITGYLYCLQIIEICRNKTGVSDIQFNAPTSYVERSTNRYGKSYRIWTNKPTEEQRQAVKWE